jgi:hypothetical protein
MAPPSHAFHRMRTNKIRSYPIPPALTDDSPMVSRRLLGRPFDGNSAHWTWYIHLELVETRESGRFSESWPSESSSKSEIKGSKWSAVGTLAGLDQPEVPNVPDRLKESFISDSSSAASWTASDGRSGPTESKISRCFSTLVVFD